MSANNTATTEKQGKAPDALASRQWWVYMVRAENGHLYTGISTDPERRFRDHQRGKGARFFNRSPASALVWWRRCEGHGDALRQELSTKALTKKAKERLISQFDSASSLLVKACALSSAEAKLSANQSEAQHE
ncbi:GIY-YIG nuclease family protein [Pseudomonas neustonica]|jgi:putative endonuclease|uniref:GIY-YIG nuclease family protein n=1 Tax=Pseudomonas neustonica TaxID=2487346 RepID=A0ABX9XIV5_9PSED|nr:MULTISPECIES: GIY-YIG nuclease family protein [Pseudomonas]ROZ83522.1 GIY-YIG nuclease family protein [Pseudomonas sp. SSM44]ROZ85380.1 GIY-YIG nuclease family protein [Pseudomonas neustonica]|tara:strand:- start:38 stop:436 length:399 start_codon:yes stop_codon:yes gene_type:complete